ncbi:MAG TPA: tetratricopeptide repeat protein [Vicinamibacterales bacterium]|nr:tetratricopeptide repeat protein [Vicinamibacterales bacterium]
MKRSFIPALLLALLATAPLAGCDKINVLKARKAFKDANVLYQRGDYREAAAKYEEALRLDPNLVVAYFYLANSYDNLYKPTRKGEPENDRYLDKAIEYYRIAAERETEPERKELALKFLVAAFGPDRKADPEQAEKYVRQMIQMEPQEPTNYFALAKIYEDVGRYEDAEQALLKAKDARPKDPQVYLQLAGFYNRQGEFEKTIQWLQERAALEPNNPEAYYLISTYYWEKAHRDFRLTEAQKRDYIMKGIEAADKAIALNPNYMEALTYKNLLLRLQANVEKDPAKQKALIAEADRLRNRAIELQKKRTAGIG